MAKSEELIVGINAVLARLSRNEGLVCLTLRQDASSRRIQEIEQLARDNQCPVERQPLAWFDSMTSLVHQGVALTVRSVEVKSEAWLDTLVSDNSGKLLLLVLDGITDPRNLGACVRSAATLGVDAVILPKDNSAPLNEAAVKTASGGVEKVPVIQVVNLSRCLDKLKRAGVWIVGTLLTADAAIDSVDLTGNIAIVLGSEDRGLRRNTVSHCDFLARIPMASGELGFNVSVAAGICLYEVHRQRVAAMH